MHNIFSFCTLGNQFISQLLSTFSLVLSPPQCDAATFNIDGIRQTTKATTLHRHRQRHCSSSSISTQSSRGFRRYRNPVPTSSSRHPHLARREARKNRHERTRDPKRNKSCRKPSLHTLGTQQHTAQLPPHPQQIKLRLRVKAYHSHDIIRNCRNPTIPKIDSLSIQQSACPSLDSLSIQRGHLPAISLLAPAVTTNITIILGQTTEQILLR